MNDTDFFDEESLRKAYDEHFRRGFEIPDSPETGHRYYHHNMTLLLIVIILKIIFICLWCYYRMPCCSPGRTVDPGVVLGAPGNAATNVTIPQTNSVIVPPSYPDNPNFQQHANMQQFSNPVMVNISEKEQNDKRILLKHEL